MTEMHYPPSWEKLRAPDMRYELMLYMKDFSNPDFQHACWATRIARQEESFDTLNNAIHEVIDMRGFDDEEFIDAHVGLEFQNQDEAERMKDFCRTLLPIVREIGRNDPDSYLQHPKWEKVIASARKVYDALGADLSPEAKGEPTRPAA